MASFRIAAAVLLLFSGLMTTAQHDRMNQKARNRMESMRIAIITSRLNLSPDEAEKFWPVYNEYRRKIDKIHAERMEMLDSRLHSKDSLSSPADAEADKMLSNILKLNDDYAKVQAEYYVRFRKMLGPKRTLDLYLGEVQFKRTIVRELRDMHDRRQE